MPEDQEFEYKEVEVPAIVEQYEEFLNEHAVDEQGMTVGDFDNMFQVWYMRMRSVYTIENLTKRIRSLIVQGEHMLAQPGFLVDDDGNPTSPILRENFADTPDEDYHKMLAEQYTEVSDEDIEELLDQEQE